MLDLTKGMQGGFQSLWARDIGDPEMLIKKVIQLSYSYLCYQFHIYKNDMESCYLYLQRSELSSVLAIITVNAFPSHHHSSQNYIRTHNAYCIIFIQTVRVL